MKMLGRKNPSWCPVCHAPAGPDCPNRGKTKRQTKRIENRQWRNYADEQLYPELEEDDA
jgi:hypothetical protein